MERKIRLAQSSRSQSTLVSMDVAEACDSVKHLILVNKFFLLNTPMYVTAWVKDGFAGRSFFSMNSRASSHFFPHLTGIPQGSVLSTFLFYVLISFLASRPEITTFLYADEIPLFA